MTRPPFQAGDFVWCAFPQRENPAVPGPLHIAYTLLVSGAAGAETSLMGYTTSQPWQNPTVPMGMFIFGKEDAEQVGQDKAFVMDLRRLAWVPITPEWFPWLEGGGDGIVGHATKRQQATYEKSATNLLTYRPETVEKLGPNWPKRR